MYTPTYQAEDFAPITIDSTAKLIITLGSLAVVLVVAFILYLFMKATRRR